MVIDETFTDRRIGVISIAGSMVRERPDALRSLFVALKFIPMQVQHNPNGDTYECCGISPQFADLGINAIPPLYAVAVNKPGKKGPAVDVKLH